MLVLAIFMTSQLFLGGSKKSEKIQGHSWDTQEDIQTVKKEFHFFCARSLREPAIYIYIVVRAFCNAIAAPLNNVKLRVFTGYFGIRVWRIAALQPPIRQPISRPLCRPLLIYLLHVIHNCKLYSYISCQSLLWFQQPLTAPPPAENLYFLDWTLNFCF